MRCFILCLLVALFFGRPSKNQHRSKLSSFIAEKIGAQTGAAYDVATYASAKRVLDYEDWYLFTVCKVQGKVVSVGALRFVCVSNVFPMQLITTFASDI